MLAPQLHKKRVVLVADDEILRRHIVSVLYTSFADLDVCGTQSAAEALGLVEDECTRLLIADAQGRVVDAPAIANAAQERRPALPLIMIGSTSQLVAPGPGRALPPLTAAWLDKPLQPERLVRLVRSLLEVPHGFSGGISLESLAELVQLLGLSNATGALHVEHESQRGSMFFEQGTVHHAHCGADKGVAAFQRMLRWSSGVFAFEREGRCNERSIQQPILQLLLETVRLIDQEHGSERPAPADEEPRTDRWPEELSTGMNGSSRFRLRALKTVRDAESDPKRVAANSFQRGMELVLSKRYEAAVQEWERALELDPSNRIYQVNLRRLHERRRGEVAGGPHGDEE
jgi:hypothetical protein